MPTEPSIWPSIVPSIVTGTTGLAGAFLGAWLGGIRDSRQRRLQDSRDALYLAVTLGAHLRRLVSECLAVAQDDGTNEFGQPSAMTGGGEEYYAPTTAKPSLKIPDLQLEWRVLPAALLDDLFSLHLSQEDTDAEIADAARFDGPPDYGDYLSTRQLGYATLGLKVLDVAERMRALVKLPPHPEVHVGFTTKQALQAVITKIEVKNAAIAAANDDAGPVFQVS